MTTSIIIGESQPLEALSSPLGNSSPEREMGERNFYEVQNSHGIGKISSRPSVQRSKGKGGRKPIYATTEERKQRNRQAQAAFRERRTEYIKQLESTIKHNEQALQSLQANHRNILDECLMLRYKNSLLERILLEKGIDVQAELQSKTGPLEDLATSQFSTVSVPASKQCPSAGQESSTVTSHLPDGFKSENPLPKVYSASVSQALSDNLPSTSAVMTSSHADTQASIITPSASKISSHERQETPKYLGTPGVVAHGSSGSPISTPISVSSHARRESMTPQLQPGTLHSFPPHQRPLSTSVYETPETPAQLYFQPHIGNTGVSAETVLANAGTSAGAQSYTGTSDGIPRSSLGGVLGPSVDARSINTNLHSSLAHDHSPSAILSASSAAVGIVTNPLFDPYDPILDVDPFGLTSSMHFSTAFTYGTK